MSRRVKVNATCPYCGFTCVVPIYTSVNVTLDPALRGDVFNDSLNRFTCTDCGKASFVAVNLIYHDMEKKFAVWFCPQGDLQEIDRKALARVSQSMGLGEYLLKAPAVHTWEEFKKTILEFEDKS